MSPKFTWAATAAPTAFFGMRSTLRTMRTLSAARAPGESTGMNSAGSMGDSPDTLRVGILRPPRSIFAFDFAAPCFNVASLGECAEMAHLVAVGSWLTHARSERNGDTPKGRL